MWLGLDGPSGGKNEVNAVHADDAIEIAWDLGHSLRLDRAEPRASRYLDEAPVRAPLASSLDALYGITAQEYLPYSLYSRRLLHRPPRSMAAYAMRVSSFAALGEGAAAIGTSTVRLGAPLDAAQAAEEQAPMERREAEAVLRQAAYDAARGRLPDGALAPETDYLVCAIIVDPDAAVTLDEAALPHTGRVASCLRTKTSRMHTDSALATATLHARGGGCHPERHVLYRGTSVLVESALRVPTAAHCCALCHDHARVSLRTGRLPCNVWAFCDPANALIPGSACNDGAGGVRERGHCWLKHHPRPLERATLISGARVSWTSGYLALGARHAAIGGNASHTPRSFAPGALVDDVGANSATDLLEPNYEQPPTAHCTPTCPIGRAYRPYSRALPNAHFHLEKHIRDLHAQRKMYTAKLPPSTGYAVLTLSPRATWSHLSVNGLLFPCCKPVHIRIPWVPFVSPSALAADAPWAEARDALPHLAMPRHTLRVNITAEDGVGWTAYSIALDQEQSAEARLANLYVRGVDMHRMDGTLAAPTFDPDVLTYRITVPFETTSVGVFANALDPRRRSVRIDALSLSTHAGQASRHARSDIREARAGGDAALEVRSSLALANSGSAESDFRAVRYPGPTEASVSLDVGANRVAVQIVAQDGRSQRVYLLHVMRGAPSTDASLASLSVWRALALGTGLGETNQRLLLNGGSLGRTEAGPVQRLVTAHDTAKGKLCSGEAAHVQVDLDAAFIQAVLDGDLTWPRADMARGLEGGIPFPAVPPSDAWRTATVPALTWHIEVKGAPIFVGLSEGVSVPLRMPLPTRKLVPSGGETLDARFADCDVASPPVRGRRYFATLLGDFVCVSADAATGGDAGGASLISVPDGRTHDARFIGGAASATSGPRCTPGCAEYTVRVVPFHPGLCTAANASDIGNPSADANLPAPAFARLGAAGHGGSTDLLRQMPSAPRWLHVPLDPRFDAARDAAVPPPDTVDPTDPENRFHAAVNYTALVPSYVSELLVTALASAPAKVTSAKLHHYDTHAPAFAAGAPPAPLYAAAIRKGGHDILPYGAGIVVPTATARQPAALESNRTIAVTLIAQDVRYRRTYVIRTTRERKSDNAFLSFLRIESQPGHDELPLSPTFNGTSDFVYSVDYTMDADTRSFRVTPVAANARYDSIYVNNKLVASGDASPPFDLGVGEHSVFITVTAEDGLAKQTYVVYLRKKPLSSDDTLRSLVLHEAKGGVLDPPFSPHRQHYVAHVAHDTPQGTLTAVATSLHYVSITIDAAKYPSRTLLTSAFNVSSGSLSLPLLLASTHFQGTIASTLLTVNVTAQDTKHQRTYTILVHRPAQPVTVHEDRLSRLACFQFVMRPDNTTTPAVPIRMEPSDFAPDVMHYELFPEIPFGRGANPSGFVYTNDTRIACEIQTFDAFANQVDLQRIYHISDYETLRRPFNTTPFSFKQLYEEFDSFITIRVRASDERFRNTYASVENTILPTARTYTLLFTNVKQPRVRMSESRWRGEFEADGDGLDATSQPTRRYAGATVPQGDYRVEVPLAGIVNNALVGVDAKEVGAPQVAGESSGALVQAMPDLDAAASAARRRLEAPVALDPRAYPVSLAPGAMGLAALETLSAYALAVYDGDLPSLGGGIGLPLCSKWLCTDSPFDVSIVALALTALGHEEVDATTTSVGARPFALAARVHLTNDGRLNFGAFGAFDGRPGGLPAPPSAAGVGIREYGAADAFFPTLVVQASAPASLALIFDLRDESMRDAALIVGTVDTESATWRPLRDANADLSSFEHFVSATFESRREHDNDPYAATEATRVSGLGAHHRSAQRPVASRAPRIVEYYVNGVLMEDHVAFARARLAPENDGHANRSIEAHVRLHPRLLHAAASSLNGPLVYGIVDLHGVPLHPERYGRIILYPGSDPRPAAANVTSEPTRTVREALELKPGFANTTRHYETHRPASSLETHVVMRVLTRSADVRCIVQNRRFRNEDGTFFRTEAKSAALLANFTSLGRRMHNATIPLVFGQQRVEVVVVSNADASIRRTYGVDIVRATGEDTTLARFALLREPIAPLAYPDEDARLLDPMQRATTRLALFATEDTVNQCDAMQRWGPLGAPEGTVAGFPHYRGIGHRLCWPNARRVRLGRRRLVDADRVPPTPFYGLAGDPPPAAATGAFAAGFYGLELGLGSMPGRSREEDREKAAASCTLSNDPVFLDHLGMHVQPAYEHIDALSGIFVGGPRGNGSVWAQDIPYHSVRITVVARAAAGPRGEVPGSSRFALYARMPGGSDVPCVDAYQHRSSHLVRHPSTSHEPSARCVTRGVEPLSGDAESTFCLPYVWLCHHTIARLLPEVDAIRSVRYTLRDLTADHGDSTYFVQYRRMPPPGYEAPDAFYGLWSGVAEPRDEGFYGASFYGMAETTPGAQSKRPADVSGFERHTRRYLAVVDYRQERAALAATPFDARARGVLFAGSPVVSVFPPAYAAPARPPHVGAPPVPPLATPHHHGAPQPEPASASGVLTGVHAGLAFDGASRSSLHARKSDTTPGSAHNGDGSATLVAPARFRSYASRALQLAVGVTRLSATVSAHAPSVSGEYAVDVIRLPSRDATLTRLVISASEPGGLPAALNYSHISPHPFDPRVLQYALYVPPHVSAISVLAEPRSARHSALTVAGNSSGSAQFSSPVTLPGCPSLEDAQPWQTARVPNNAYACVVPPLAVPVRVVAEDGVTSLTYTVTILRGEGPLWGRTATLTRMSASVDGAPVVAEPSFRAHTFDYSVSLPRSAYTSNATLVVSFAVANRGAYAVLANGNHARAAPVLECAAGRSAAAYVAKYGLHELVHDHSSRVEVQIKPFWQTDPRVLGGEDVAAADLSGMPPVYHERLFRTYALVVAFGPPAPFSSSSREPVAATGLSAPREVPPHASHLPNGVFPSAPGHAQSHAETSPAWKVRPRAEEGVGVLSLATRTATLDASPPRFAATCDGGAPLAADVDWRGSQSFGVEREQPDVALAHKLTARTPTRADAYIVVPSWADNVLRLPRAPAIELASLSPGADADEDAGVRNASDETFGVANLDLPPCPRYPFVANAFFDVARDESGAQLAVRASEPAVAHYAAFRVHDARHPPRVPTPRELFEQSRADAATKGAVGVVQGAYDERWLLRESRAPLSGLVPGALYHVYVVLADRALDLVGADAANLQLAPTRIAHVACDASACRYRDDPAVLLTPEGSLTFACECVGFPSFYGVRFNEFEGLRAVPPRRRARASAGGAMFYGLQP